MNKPVTIYAITRTKTSQSYVGSSVSVATRWYHHRMLLRRDAHHCHHLQRAWNKYGECAFEFTVLEEIECATREARYLAEVAWIKQIGHYNYLVASDRAGQFTVSEENRRRISEAALARIEANPEYRDFLAARGAAMAAYMQSPEGRANIGQHTKRRWQDPDERAKLARGLENRWADPTAREHMAKKTGDRMRSGTAAADHAEKLRAAWVDPEKGARLRARLESRWADPEAKARQSENMRRIWAERRAAKATG